jgi:hypothetical protein
MVIAKIENGSGTTNIIYGKKITLNPGDKLILNPLLENFFMVHTLVGNNLRYILSGSEINHKIKSLGKLNLSKTLFKYKEFLKSYGINDLSEVSVDDIKYALNLAASDNNISMLPTEEISYIGDSQLVTSREEV